MDLSDTVFPGVYQTQLGCHLRPSLLCYLGYRSTNFLCAFLLLLLSTALLFFKAHLHWTVLHSNDNFELLENTVNIFFNLSFLTIWGRVDNLVNLMVLL